MGLPALSASQGGWDRLAIEPHEPMTQPWRLVWLYLAAYFGLSRSASHNGANLERDL